MKNIKDKKIIILGAILLIFTISYFIIANKISYAFSTNDSIKSNYSSLMDTIKECAKKYAEKNSDIFKDDKIAYIKVQDLIDDGLLAPNEDGNIVSPLDNNTILNSNIIKLKNDNDEINIEIDN